MEGELPQRPKVSEAEKLLGVKKPVLDHGYVCLVDYMGSDSSVIQAARVSFGPGTKVSRSDVGLIRYLMRNRHTSPFEMVEFKFLMRLPIFVARQIVRHRTANINEVSGRMSILPSDFYIPAPDTIRSQSKVNKQGRDQQMPDEVVVEFRKRLSDLSAAAYRDYEWAEVSGIARELSRLFLPVNIYTEWYWKIDLHNLFHFLNLRLDPHAQFETREYARVMADVARSAVPVCFEAFEDFVLGSIRLSKKEQAALSRVIKGVPFEEACRASNIQLLDEKGDLLRSGEGPEFQSKLARIASYWQ